MTVETEQSKKVSNESLLKDIEITRNEIWHFEMILAHLFMLEQLAGDDSYQLEIESYRRRRDMRFEFLAQLDELKKERRL